MEIRSYLKHLIVASSDIVSQPCAEVDSQACNVRYLFAFAGAFGFFNLNFWFLAMYVADSAFLGKA
jgi:hypothetical protein